MSQNEFKAIPGYERYQINTQGVVLGVRGGIIKPQLDKEGYYIVSMRASSRQKNPDKKRLHALVMETFVGPRPAGLHVNHKDNDKSNNTLSNLEYCTPQYNYEQKKIHGVTNRILTDVQVQEIRDVPRQPNIINALAQKYGVSRSLIIKIRGREIEYDYAK